MHWFEKLFLNLFAKQEPFLLQEIQRYDALGKCHTLNKHFLVGVVSYTPKIETSLLTICR